VFLRDQRHAAPVLASAGYFAFAAMQLAGRLSVLVPIVFGAVGHGSAAEYGSASVTGAVAKFTTLSYTGAARGLGPPMVPARQIGCHSHSGRAGFYDGCCRTVSVLDA
jgi:hypothetical protein